MRGGQRSFFAVICIAVGVASLVALESLSQSIADTLTGDTRARAGGDLVANVSNRENQNNPEVVANLSNQLDTLKKEGFLTDWTPFQSSNPSLVGYFGLPPVFYAVDPAKYPLSGELKILEPQGKSFKSLISETGSLVVSKNLWEKQNYKLGQVIEVQGEGLSSKKRAKLKIVGQAAIDIPGVLLGTGQFLGFGFTSLETAASFQEASTLIPDTYFFTSSKPPEAKIELQKLKTPLQTGGTIPTFSRVLTAADQQEQLARGLNVTEDLLAYVGLLSLLIGGIGVINTMLVVIGRRTTEIATVKALGLKTNQTFLIFTLEAVILGVMGSILGVILGELLGLGIKGVAEGLFARPLNWGFYGSPIIIGFVVGTLTAAVFGFLPSYAAGKVRPGVVLRLQSGGLPGIGGWASLLIVLLMTLSLGLIAGILLRDLVLGILICFLTLAVSALMVGGMWVIVLLVGKLPTPFGPGVKMAFRSFSRHRGRTAATVMVMVVGLFFISFIVIIADSIKAAVKDAVDLDLGYNVVAFNPFSSETETTRKNLKAQVPGLQKLFLNNGKDVSLIAINGVSSAFNETVRPTPNPSSGRNPDTQKTGPRFPGFTLTGRGLEDGTVPGANGKQKILAGRDLINSDSDKKVLLVTKDVAARYNLTVGNKLTVQSSINGIIPGRASGQTKEIILDLVGIIDRGSSAVNFETPWVVPYQLVNDLGANYNLYFLLIDRNNLKAGLEKVQKLAGFVLDLNDIIDTFNRLLDQLLAFPLLLSLLSLFSGAILIANNVALAMLERRTEIGVLKAIGAKKSRIMRLLLWESGLVGLLGGIIGVGSGILIALNISSLTGGRGNQLNVSWSPLTALLLVGLSIVLAIGATLTSAWGAIKEKPLVVLRYE